MGWTICVSDSNGHGRVIFTEAGLGCLIIESAPHADERGEFVRIYDADEFRERGLALPIVQTSLSTNTRIGTLRGLHFQAAPHEEAKLVRCLRGRIFDVAVDVRSRSPTFGRWVGTVLEATGQRSMFIPEGLAHGFLTLEESSEVMYAISQAHVPSSQRGLRWDDPEVGIQWPRLPGPLTISPQDNAWPSLAELPRTVGAQGT